MLRVARVGLGLVLATALVACDRRHEQDESLGHEGHASSLTSERTTSGFDAAVAESFSIPSNSGSHTVQLRRDATARHAEFHEWKVRVVDSEDVSIPPGPISFDGAMPAHRHGFENRPLITGRDAEGWHRVEGVRFHMPGDWVLRVDFVDGTGVDYAEVDYSVPY